MDKPETTPAETLAQAHATLREELGRLERAAHAPSDAMPLELRNDLERVRTCLAEHFRIEEENGYLSTVLKSLPHLERPARRLLEEHRLLAHSLDALLAEAGHPPRAGTALRGQVLAWIEQVRAHETRENLLVEDAFNLDLGTDD